MKREDTVHMQPAGFGVVASLVLRLLRVLYISYGFTGGQVLIDNTVGESEPWPGSDTLVSFSGAQGNMHS